MKKLDRQILYWNRMINEAMEEKGKTDSDAATEEDFGWATQTAMDGFDEKTRGDVKDFVLGDPETASAVREDFESMVAEGMTRGQAAYWCSNRLKSCVQRYYDSVNGRKLNERAMVGPAGAARGRNDGVDEIADFRQKLENGVVEFQFLKRDGTRRHAVGTTSEAIVPTEERRRLDPSYDENMASYMRREAFIIWFWDLEKSALRCFNTNRFEDIIRYQPTAQRVTPQIERVGNIFIHRDVDDGMDDPAQPLTPQRVESINQRLQADLSDAGNYDGIAAVVTDGLRVNPEDLDGIEIERMPDGRPLLRIVIRKNGANVNNGQYTLDLGHFRSYILERYGVDVKKVVVDGEFTFN